jgi:hypothetical protein
MRNAVVLLFAALMGAVASPSWCAEEEEEEEKASDANRLGDWFVHARYRFETVERDDPLRTANASTLRTSAGYETDPERLLGAMIEVENVQHIGAEQFNSTTNGRTDYDVVADPDGTELNQAYLTLQRSGFRARGGRQALVLDNARFVGDVNFRQNQQTYDSLTLQATTPGGSRLIYGYLWRVNRFFGEDNPVGELRMRTHLLNYSLGRTNGDRLTAYAYLIELDELAFRSTSTQTYGASYDGSIDISSRKLIYRAEYALQSDYADNPGPSNAWYGNVEVGVRFESLWTLTAGAELLSGNGRYGFQTPLATAHKFNGFADVFAASTPPGGIDDRYLRLYAPVAGARVTVSWHDFRSDDAGEDYGTELDAEINWRLTPEWLIGVKYADYRSEGFSTDTRKAWLWVQADF